MAALLNYGGIFGFLSLMMMAIWTWSWQYFWMAFVIGIFWCTHVAFCLDRLKIKPYKLFLVPKDHIIGE